MPLHPRDCCISSTSSFSATLDFQHNFITHILLPTPQSSVENCNFNARFSLWKLLALQPSKMGCLSKKMAFLGLVLIMLHMTPCSCSSRKLKGMVQQSPLNAVLTMAAKMNSFSAMQISTTKNSENHFLKGWIETWSTKHPRLFLHEVHTGPNPISNSFPLAKRKPIPQSP